MRTWHAHLSVSWALLPVCFGESKPETGQSAQLTVAGKEVEEVKEVASFASTLAAESLTTFSDGRLCGRKW